MKLLFSFLLCLSLCWGEDIIISGTGYGISQEEALRKAKQDALAKGIGQTLVSQTEVENFMVKRDLILTKTAGSIKNYKILKQKQELDKAWLVEIQATVSKDNLKKDLTALMILRESIGNPRIAFFLQESNMAKTSSVVSNELIQSFAEKGFEVIDPNKTLPFRESTKGNLALQGNLDAAASLGSIVNAEVIIVGQATATEADMSHHSAFKNSTMKSASANIALKAINVSTRRILAASSEQSSAIHANPQSAGQNAFRTGVKRLMQKENQFFDRLTTAWQQSANDGSLFTITIEGIDSFAQTKHLRSSLQQLSQSVQQRSFQKPTLIVDLKYLGPTDDLCQRLESLRLPQQKLVVTGYTGNSIQLKLK